MSKHGEAAAHPVRAGSWRLIRPVLAIVGVLVALGLVRRFVIAPYSIPTGSMRPTLLPGDHMLVLKGGDVRRGDVVVFQFPGNPSVEYVQRVIAVGGDKLEVADGRPVINGELVPECYVGKYQSQAGPLELYLEYGERHAYGVLFREQPPSTSCASTRECPNGETCIAGICAREIKGPYQVAADEFWVLGDNRDNAFDSRAWSGGRGAGVPVTNLIGRPWRIIMNPTEQSRSSADPRGLPALTGDNAPLQSALDACVAAHPTAR